jgi:hypothetical protein
VLHAMQPSISAVSSNYVTLANSVKKAKTGLYTGATDRYTLENFNQLIKNSIDGRDKQMLKTKKRPNKFGKRVLHIAGIVKTN